MIFVMIDRKQANQRHKNVVVRRSAPSKNGDDHNLCITTNWNFVFGSDDAHESDLSQ